jgi:hypothetical protein
MPRMVRVSVPYFLGPFLLRGRNSGLVFPLVKNMPWFSVFIGRTG